MACQKVCKQGRDDINSEGKFSKPHIPALFSHHVKRCRDRLLMFIKSCFCTFSSVTTTCVMFIKSCFVLFQV